MDDMGAELGLVSLAPERGTALDVSLGSGLLAVVIIGCIVVKGWTSLLRVCAMNRSKSGAGPNVFFRRRRSHTSRARIIAIKARPPSTPPTMAPMGESFELPTELPPFEPGGVGADAVKKEVDNVEPLLVDDVDVEEAPLEVVAVGVAARISKVGESIRKTSLVVVARTTYCFPGGSTGISNKECIELAGSSPVHSSVRFFWMVS